jgi:uncharacterized protein (TIGR00369 family)
MRFTAENVAINLKIMTNSIKKPKYRSVDYSKTTITELMIPAYANFGGKIHGGIILSLMDKVAYVCAAKHAGGYCVTVSMNAVDFLAPVEVGDLVHLHASVNYVGKSSIVIGVKVESENITNGDIKHTNTSYLTMVALDENRNPISVPGLILESQKDIRRYLEAKKRKELIKEYKETVNKTFESLNLDSEINNIIDDNCIVIDDK